MSLRTVLNQRTLIHGGEYVWGPFKYAKIKHFSAPRAYITEFFPAERQVRVWLQIPDSPTLRLQLKMRPPLLTVSLTFSRAGSVCRSDGVPRNVLLPDVPFHRLGMSCCDDLDLGSHHGVLLSPEVKVTFSSLCSSNCLRDLWAQFSFTFNPLYSSCDLIYHSKIIKSETRYWILNKASRREA